MLANSIKTEWKKLKHSHLWLRPFVSMVHRSFMVFPFTSVSQRRLASIAVMVGIKIVLMIARLVRIHR